MVHKSNNNYIKKTTKKENQINNETFVDEKNKDYGIVIGTTYHDADVLYKNNIIKVKLSKTFNSICNKTIYPGDKVILNEKNQEIEKIVQRKNILCREKQDGSKMNGFGVTKVVATNIDLAVIVVSAQEPPLHPKFIDRYLILLKSNHIPFIIVMNKCELKTKKEEEILNIYKHLGITVIETSTTKNIGITELKKELINKQTILVGHSGVGKSSLVNTIRETSTVKVGSISEKTKKGCHTTTASYYYCWEESSSIIDTPGIRSLDISQFNTQEIQEYFPEFTKLKGKCKYKNCLHYEEPVEECFIKQNVEQHFINEKRYESYIKIIQELLTQNKSR